MSASFSDEASPLSAHMQDAARTHTHIYTHTHTHTCRMPAGMKSEFLLRE
jgi:hypothetical protein